MSFESLEVKQVRESSLFAGLNDIQQKYLNKLIAEYEEHFGQIKLDELEVQINRGDRKARQIYMAIVDKLKEIVDFLATKKMVNENLRDNRPWHLEEKPIHVNNSLGWIDDIAPVPNSNDLLIMEKPLLLLMNEKGEKLGSEAYGNLTPPSKPAFDGQTGKFYAFYPAQKHEIKLVDPKNNFKQEIGFKASILLMTERISMQVSPDGRWLAVISGREMEIIDTSDLNNPDGKKHIINITDDHRFMNFQEKAKIVFSPDSKKIYISVKDEIYSVSHEGDSWQMSISEFSKNDESPVTKLIQSEDGKTLFSVHENGLLRIWDLTVNGRKLPRYIESESGVLLPNVDDMVVTKDGQELILLLNAKIVFSVKNLPVEGKPDWTSVSSSSLGRVGVVDEAQLKVSGDGSIIYLKSGRVIRKIVRE